VYQLDSHDGATLPQRTVNASAPLQVLLKRDRAIVAGGLALIAALAWLYLLRLAGAMSEMDRHMGMAAPTVSDAAGCSWPCSSWRA